jgi:hypothetical protein
MNKIKVGMLHHKVPERYKSVYIGRAKVKNRDMSKIDEFKGQFGNTTYKYETYKPPKEHVKLLSKELDNSNLFLQCFCIKEPMDVIDEHHNTKCHGMKLALEVLKENKDGTNN